MIMKCFQYISCNSQKEILYSVAETQTDITEVESEDEIEEEPEEEEPEEEPEEEAELSLIIEEPQKSVEWLEKSILLVFLIIYVITANELYYSFFYVMPNNLI